MTVIDRDALAHALGAAAYKYDTDHNEDEWAECLELADVAIAALGGTPSTPSTPSASTLGGRVVNIDDLLISDGVLDPFHFARTLADGVEMAASMILSVNPFGDRKLDFEGPLTTALNYGVANGATCTGQALQISLEAGQANRQMVERIFDLVDSSPMFRTMISFEPARRPDDATHP